VVCRQSLRTINAPAGRRHAVHHSESIQSLTKHSTTTYRTPRYHAIPYPNHNIGIDQENDEYVESSSQQENDEEMQDANANNDNEEAEEEIDELAKKEAKELEAAKRERMELIASERKALANDVPDQGKATLEEKFHYLVSQSEVFAHFLAGE